MKLKTRNIEYFALTGNHCKLEEVNPLQPSLASYGRDIALENTHSTHRLS